MDFWLGFEMVVCVDVCVCGGGGVTVKTQWHRFYRIQKHKADVILKCLFDALKLESLKTYN